MTTSSTSSNLPNRLGSHMSPSDREAWAGTVAHVEASRIPEGVRIISRAEYEARIDAHVAELRESMGNPYATVTINGADVLEDDEFVAEDAEDQA
jgi:hypothetical protein